MQVQKQEVIHKQDDNQTQLLKPTSMKRFVIREAETLRTTVADYGPR